MNKISFVLGQGGLGRPLPGQDYYSGLLCFCAANLPAGFTANTSATASQAVTVESTAGDEITQISVNGVYLLNATITLPGTSELDDATRICNAINAFSGTSGYTATVGAGGAFTINGPVSLGASINTLYPVYTFGTDATLAIGTNNAFTGGVTTGGSPIRQVFSWRECVALGMAVSDADPDLALFAYAAQMYFEANPSGTLWLYPYKSAAAAHVFGNLAVLQNYTGGKIRQMGIVSSLAFVYTDLNLIKAQRVALQALNRPCEFIYGADTHTVSDYSTLYDLSSLSDEGVSAVFGQDGAGVGAALAVRLGVSAPMVGTALGAVSFAKVHEDIAWVAKFDISNNSIGEFNQLAFGDGTLISDISVTPGIIDAINSKRYIFGVYQDGISGSYFNDSHCACALTSDYAYIENNRTINKAQRNIRVNMTPALNSPLYVNADGTLTEDTIAEFKNLAEQPLETMGSNGELSDFQVLIDPTQDVLSTSELDMSVTIVPVGVARNIVINIKYAVKIAA